MAKAFTERYNNLYNGNVVSTNTSTGTLIIVGGAGIGGNLHVGGSFTVGTLNSGNLSTQDLTVAGNLTVDGNTTILNTEIVRVEDHNIELGNVATPTNTTANDGGIILLAGTDGNKTLTWTSSSNSWTSNQDFNLTSGKVYEINGTQVLSSNQLGSAITFNANTASTSTGTGTLVVTGGVGVSGNLNVGGTIIGGSIQNTPIGNATPSSGSFTTLVSSANTQVGGTLNVITAANISAVTSSTSTNSGALLVAGGTGVGGNLNVGGTIIGGSIQNTPIGSTTRNSGAFTSLTANGAVTFTQGITSSSTSTGTLVVTGGAGVSGNLNVGGNIKFSGNTQSTSTESGTLVVTGGVGVGGDFWIGGNVFVDNNKVFEAATAIVTTLNVVDTDIVGDITVNGTLNVNKLNPGITLLSSGGLFATSTPKVSIKVPINFKSVAETNIFTVPADTMFLIDSMEILTTDISTPGDPPTVRLGNTADANAYYGPTQVTTNSIGSRHIIDNPQDGVVAGTTVTCGITVGSTAIFHSGFIKITGELIDLNSEGC